MLKRSPIVKDLYLTQGESFLTKFTYTDETQIEIFSFDADTSVIKFRDPHPFCGDEKIVVSDHQPMLRSANDYLDGAVQLIEKVSDTEVKIADVFKYGGVHGYASLAVDLSCKQFYGQIRPNFTQGKFTPEVLGNVAPGQNTISVFFRPGVEFPVRVGCYIDLPCAGIERALVKAVTAEAQMYVIHIDQHAACGCQQQPILLNTKPLADLIFDLGKCSVDSSLPVSKKECGIVWGYIPYDMTTKFPINWVLKKEDVKASCAKCPKSSAKRTVEPKHLDLNEYYLLGYYDVYCAEFIDNPAIPIVDRLFMGKVYITPSFTVIDGGADSTNAYSEAMMGVQNITEGYAEFT